MYNPYKPEHGARCMKTPNNWLCNVREQFAPCGFVTVNRASHSSVNFSLQRNSPEGHDPGSSLQNGDALRRPTGMDTSWRKQTRRPSQGQEQNSSSEKMVPGIGVDN